LSLTLLCLSFSVVSHFPLSLTLLCLSLFIVLLTFHCILLPFVSYSFSFSSSAQTQKLIEI
jgi:hypothetical protein